VEEDFEMERCLFSLIERDRTAERETRISYRYPREDSRKSEEEDRLVLMCSRLSASTLPLSTLDQGEREISFCSVG
jgi:hypothetical protein